MLALVVDNDRGALDSLCATLARDGFEVITGRSGDQAIAGVAERRPDVLLLEQRLPDIDGCEVCRRIRRLADPIRILMFSDAPAVQERVRGLEAGADAYMSKPLVAAEVTARVRAMFRRGEHGPARAQLSWGGVTLDPGLYAVSAAAARRELTPTEYRLLELFMRNPERTLSHAEIGASVWGRRQPGPTNLRVYVGYLRRKLHECGAGKLIHTVPREGYVLRRA